ncbi:MAG TPA: FMN-binding glutamate synthase family protein [Chitinophagaceae bacterium]|nr:FMN-binding glutamate synthase family protein [Chitinophagaceae bacterium]
MFRIPQRIPAATCILVALLLGAIGALWLAAMNPGFFSYVLALISLALLALAVYHRLQRKKAILRNFPLVGGLRYFLESIRAELRQYFFESDLDGRPFNRRQRSLVYQRAKNQRQTVAFGMLDDPMRPGFEWVSHALFPLKGSLPELRTWIGGPQCMVPYQASLLNIGAMSYGALSRTAVTALNQGARLGGFAHNTGEGGISPYHLEGGDLIWQIGTGYFGCRDEAGRFSASAFREKARMPQVKMIELKLSQGAKPGHGGLLPASKNTAEIAAIRLVKPGIPVHSPASHTAFQSPKGLIRFLQTLRELSGGKPVGFKLCLGQPEELELICRAIRSTGILPDFITVDGAEGGTGAAPLEFTDSVGMPLLDALSEVTRILRSCQLDRDIKVIASGKLVTAFDILKVLAMGASACYSARGMMLSLGCIQALVCDSGRCPTGVATQDPALYRGLDPGDKSVRVASYHAATIRAVGELMQACGFATPEDIRPDRFFRRMPDFSARSFQSIYGKFRVSTQPAQT